MLVWIDYCNFFGSPKKIVERCTEPVEV